MFIFSVIGETTFDIGPGDWISIAASLCPGIVVAVNVALGLGVRVGAGVSEGASLGVKATAVSVMDVFAAPAVNAITVGRYSGG
jgi:hypothetical protein